MRKWIINIKEYFIKIKKNPKIILKDIKSRTKNYWNKNILFIVFVLTSVINASLLRYLTMHTVENYLSFKPILADFSVVLLVGAFGYLFKPKKRFIYYMVWNLFFTAICIINSVYYTFYTSFSSISMLSLTQFIAPVGDAITENVMNPKDFIYLLSPVILIITHIYLKRRKFYLVSEEKNDRKKSILNTLIVSGICIFLFTINLTSLEVGRFAKQWNREYIVMKFGIYVYHINDLVKSIEPKISTLFGYDKANKSFNEYFEDINEPIKTNEYTNMFKGKNIISIHAESIQDLVIGLDFNNELVAPNLTRLANEGLYFNNFYSQVSVGTSSDSELTLNTSLMPTQNGTAFVSYFDREYISIPKLLKEQGYYTFSMHANTADFWNRRIMHQNLGYDHFYSKKDFEVTKENWIGLGLSDKSFFEQAIPMIKEVNNKGKPFYGTMIMLSNHTPFSEVDKYGEFDVDIKEEIVNENGETEIISHPYLEGTKLGNYFKSVHYADSALGEFINALDENGLLENTVIIIYGDHDARLPKTDYIRMLNYDTTTDEILDKNDPAYINFDSYQYELNRKVPFIIWSKDKKLETKVDNVMGMYDVMPTLGNMFGFNNPYALGHDIFNIKEDNIVIFPNGNWVTNKVYYNSQKNEHLVLKEEAISQEYIDENNLKADRLLEVSNNIIVFDLIKKNREAKEALGAIKEN